MSPWFPLCYTIDMLPYNNDGQIDKTGGKEEKQNITKEFIVLVALMTVFNAYHILSKYPNPIVGLTLLAMMVAVGYSMSQKPGRRWLVRSEGGMGKPEIVLRIIFVGIVILMVAGERVVQSYPGLETIIIICTPLLLLITFFVYKRFSR